MTVTDAVLAFPIAFYMAKVASRRTRNLLVVAILLPLWASYLVKVYAWRIILQEEGLLNWVLVAARALRPRLRERGDVARLLLPVAAVHDPARLRGPRAHPGVAARSVCGSRRPGRRTFRRVVLPLALPALAAGSIFTFSLTLGDYITPQLVSSTQFIGNVVYINVGVANNLPFAAAFATVPVAVMVVYLLLARRRGSVREPVTSSRRHLGAARSDGADARVHLPAAARDRPLRVQHARSLVWPIEGLTTKWFGRAIDNPGVRDALLVSLKAALGATAIALVLGTVAALAVARYRFFGREAISFLVILPLALPGIVTGMALNATFRNLPEPFGVDLGLFTIMVGHATFCIVVVYNNVVARLRRTAALARGGLGRPRRRRLADVPLRHVSAAEDGAARRRAARVRAQLRRGDRDDVHRRRRPDAADLDPQQPVAPEPASDRERRRGVRDPALDDPGLLRLEALERVERAAASPAARARRR